MTMTMTMKIMVVMPVATMQIETMEQVLMKIEKALDTILAKKEEDKSGGNVKKEIRNNGVEVKDGTM